MRTERAEHDSQGRKRLEQLADEEPLFLTEDGKPYHRSAFYYHWEKLFEAAQKRFKKQERVAFSPHDIRHLRVTRGITKIKQEAKGDKELEGRTAGWFLATHGLAQRTDHGDLHAYHEPTQSLAGSNVR